MKSERRLSNRKQVGLISVSNVSTLKPLTIVTKHAEIVDASSTGILLYLNRNDLVPKTLRGHLTLKSLEGERVTFRIAEMELDMDGVVSRTRFVGNGLFEVAIDFSDEAPEYWRECLVDLLPDVDEDI